MTTRQLTLLLAIRAGVCSFRDLSAAIERLQAEGLITEELQLTEAGRQATAGYLLSRCGERVTGVWRVDRVATAHYSSPLMERESVVCTAEEYEAMQS